MTEEEVAANFSFLTMDDALCDDSNTIQLHRRRADLAMPENQGNKVFVWGLNDVHQLGSGVSEVKVRRDNTMLVKFGISSFSTELS